jgi:uncharacterized protein YjiS (DUF1127 family)
MIHLNLWRALASCLCLIRSIQATQGEYHHLRGELERLLALGEHLIQDIGFDPDEVRAWLKDESREARVGTDPTFGLRTLSAVRSA